MSVLGVYGARPAVGGRRGATLFEHCAAQELMAFVVPGRDLLRARGLELDAAGLRAVATPRHANVLLVVGNVPDALLPAVATCFAQMPRPRLIVAVGTGPLKRLPPPDVECALDPAAFVSAVARARALLLERAGGSDARAFVDPALEPKERHDGSGHGEGDHGDDSGGGMGMMSMAEMTSGMPRGADGLAMERVEAPFGPLFPGLPAGLGLTLTLDGDVVAKAKLDKGLLTRRLLEGLPLPASTFVERLSELDPLSSATYRILGERALEGAAGVPATQDVERARIGRLERERMVSHLSWLLEFSELLGCEGIAKPAARVLVSARAGPCAQLLASVNQLVKRVRRTPLLDRRLRGVGCVRNTTETLRGPVARASGREDDVRKEDRAYAALGFATVVGQGGDARSRLWVRLAELEHSAGLLDRAGESLPKSPHLPAGFSGSAEVQLEAPRGRAALRLDVRDGAVVSAALDTPSSVHLELVSGLCADQELSDALVAVSSLDLSLWEVDR